MTVLNKVTGEPLEIDAESLCLATIEREHHEIHEGDHFVATDIASAIATRDYLVVTPAKTMHLLIDMGTDGKVQLTVYRNAIATTSATKVPAVNSNHNSAVTSAVDISVTPTGITTGSDVVWQDFAGSGQKSGGMSRSQAEMNLKPNTKYLFRFVGTSTPTLLARWTWYEETDQ
jgi:hypothetical protein